MTITLESLKKNAPLAENIPEWAISITTQKLYTFAVAQYNEIKSNIEQGKVKTTRDISLIARRIAIACGVSPSTITARRQPELVNFLSQKNAELNTLYISVSAARREGSRHLTKKELLKENHELKSQITALKTLALGEYASAILHSTFPAKSRDAALTIAKLKEEIDRQSLIISNQAEQNRKYMEALSKT